MSFHESTWNTFHWWRYDLRIPGIYMRFADLFMVVGTGGYQWSKAAHNDNAPVKHV